MTGAAVYGQPRADLVEPPVSATQLSPIVQGAVGFDGVPLASLDRIDVEAPANTLERQYVLAQSALRLRPGGSLNAVARKTRGGLRLRRELETLGLAVAEEARRGHRVCRGVVGGDLDTAEAERAVLAGGPRFVPALSLWSQPGLFSWDRLDPGTSLLIDHLDGLAGAGADFGCGLGVLGGAVLRSPRVSSLILIDVDARAVALSRRNIDDPRASFLRWDLRQAVVPANGSRLDFVVSNPPFHHAGQVDVGLGRAFIASARAWLADSGRLLLVANAELPYERLLLELFRDSRQIVRAAGFKVLEGRA